jgi:hypothetical protein
LYIFFVIQLNSFIETHPKLSSEMAIFVDLFFANVN